MELCNKFYLRSEYWNVSRLLSGSSSHALRAFIISRNFSYDESNPRDEIEFHAVELSVRALGVVYK